MIEDKVQYEMTVVATIDMAQVQRTADEIEESLEEVLADLFSGLLVCGTCRPNYMELAITSAPVRTVLLGTGPAVVKLKEPT